MQNLLHKTPSVGVDAGARAACRFFEHPTSEVKCDFGTGKSSVDAVDVFLGLVRRGGRRAVGHETHVLKLGGHVHQVVEGHALAQNTLCLPADRHR